MFPFGKKKAVILDPRPLRYFRGNPPTVLFVPPMNHRIEVEGPFRNRGPKVTVAHGRQGNHLPGHPGDLAFPDSPHRHCVAAIARFLMAQDGPEPADQPPADESPDPSKKGLLFPSGPPPDFRKGGRHQREIALDLPQEPHVPGGKFFSLHRKVRIALPECRLIYSTGEKHRSRQSWILAPCSVRLWAREAGRFRRTGAARPSGSRGKGQRFFIRLFVPRPSREKKA